MYYYQKMFEVITATILIRIQYLPITSLSIQAWYTWIYSGYRPTAEKMCINPGNTLKREVHVHIGSRKVLSADFR